MGGEAGVDSQPGKGSCFWITARLHAPGASDTGQCDTTSLASAEEHLAARHAGRRILVAEDEPVNSEVACELLSIAGLHTDVAFDGQEAVDKAGTGHYDLILMDMQMPVLNGLEATRRIRALPNGTDVPIVAMTANAFQEDRQTCLAAGMNDHIGKPCDPDVLYATLLRWLDAGRQPDSGAAEQ